MLKESRPKSNPRPGRGSIPGPTGWQSEILPTVATSYTQINSTQLNSTQIQLSTNITYSSVFCHETILPRLRPFVFFVLIRQTADVSNLLLPKFPQQTRVQVSGDVIELGQGGLSSCSFRGLTSTEHDELNKNNKNVV